SKTFRAGKRGLTGLAPFSRQSVCYYPTRSKKRRVRIMAESSGGDKFLWLVAGAGIGAVLALLFAPKSGRETRELIARTATDGRDFLTNKVSEGRQFVGETGRKVGDDFSSFIDKSKEAL